MPKVKLLIKMQKWADFHNELDCFVVDWENKNQRKWGVCLYQETYIDYNFDYNEFVFGISVATEEMLKPVDMEIT